MKDLSKFENEIMPWLDRFMYSPFGLALVFLVFIVLWVSTFQLDYTHATLQAAGASNYITISRSLDSLFKRKEGESVPKQQKDDGARQKYRKVES